MIKYGNNNIDSIFFGNQEICEAYLGDQLIWSKYDPNSGVYYDKYSLINPAPTTAPQGEDDPELPMSNVYVGSGFVEPFSFLNDRRFAFNDLSGCWEYNDEPIHIDQDLNVVKLILSYYNGTWIISPITGAVNG